MPIESRPKQPMPRTLLTDQLAAQITDFIRAEKAPKGARLVERKLAEHLRVSRSPVRSALRLLEAEGVVGSAEGGGFVVLETGRSLSARRIPTVADDEIYHRIAGDRLNGELAERVTENALARQYGL